MRLTCNCSTANCIAASTPCRPHQIGDVAHREDVARVAAQQHGRIHPRIAAADQQGAGVLAFAQIAVKRWRVLVVLLLKALEAVDQPFDIAHVSLLSAP
jgi:hypothetical protein